MARFYFTTLDGGVVPDPSGLEFADASAAKLDAIRFAGEWLRDGCEEFARDRRQELTVTNDDGVVMWVITTQLTNGPGDAESAAPSL